MRIQARAAGGERGPGRFLPRVERDIADGAQYERHNTRDYDRSHLSALHVPTAAAKHSAAKNLSVSRRCEIELNQMGDAALTPHWQRQISTDRSPFKPLPACGIVRR